jgi:beta-lactamase class A
LAGTAKRASKKTTAKPTSKSQDLAKLRAEINKVTRDVKGQAGYYIKHIESGKELSSSPDKVFPLGSVFKIAVMVETYRQVGEKRLSLDERLELETKYYCIGDGILQFLQPGLKPTIRDLLALMIIEGDNTASEMLWKRIGIQRVNMLIRELGLAKTSVYIPYRESFLMSMGYGPFKDLPIPEAAHKWASLPQLERMKALNQTEREAANLSIEEFRKKYEAIYGTKAEKKLKVQRVYDEAFDNLGTPREIAIILEKIAKHEIVSPEACEEMLSLLIRQKDIGGMSCLLSPDIPVALKYGVTAASVANASLIYLSSNSHVVLCCFFKNIPEGHIERASIAEAKIARLVYDFFSSVKSR